MSPKDDVIFLEIEKWGYMWIAKCSYILPNTMDPLCWSNYIHLRKLSWLIICPGHCKLLFCQHVGANKLSRQHLLVPYPNQHMQLISVLISSGCTWSPEGRQLMSPLPYFHNVEMFHSNLKLANVFLRILIQSKNTTGRFILKWLILTWLPKRIGLSREDSRCWLNWKSLS